ncbi:MAG: AI-2E family transporter [Tissierellia bacterium]|nr:AI-2E family transporter [Tissierellia bacterium]
MNLINKSKSITKILAPVLLIIFIMLLVVFSPKKISGIVNSFKPVLYALVISYLLDSIVRLCTGKLHVSRTQGILIAFILLIGIVMFIISIIVPKIVENINNIISFLLNENIDIEEIVTNIKDKVDYPYVQYVADSILKAGETIQDKINSILLYLSNTLLQIITNVGSSTLSIVTSLIISIYMLNEKEDLLARGRRLIYAFFNNEKANKILYIFSRSNIIFKSFLNGKILDSLIVGTICIGVFTIFKVPYAVLMGTLLGVFNIIPFFGPIIGAVPVIIVSLFTDPSKAVTALIIILVIQQIDANFLDPKIVGNNVGVSPFWILTAVTIGGSIGGIPGMVFGVPIVVLVKTITEEYIEMRLLEKGMSDYQKDNMQVMKIKEKKKFIKH